MMAQGLATWGGGTNTVRLDGFVRLWETHEIKMYWEDKAYAEFVALLTVLVIRWRRRWCFAIYAVYSYAVGDGRFIVAGGWRRRWRRWQRGGVGGKRFKRWWCRTRRMAASVCCSMGKYARHKSPSLSDNLPQHISILPRVYMTIAYTHTHIPHLYKRRIYFCLVFCTINICMYVERDSSELL